MLNIGNCCFVHLLCVFENKNYYAIKTNSYSNQLLNAMCEQKLLLFHYNILNIVFDAAKPIKLCCSKMFHFIDKKMAQPCTKISCLSLSW